MKRSEFFHAMAALLGAGCSQAPVAVPPPPPPPAPPPAPPAPPEKQRVYKHWAWLSSNAEATGDWYKREFERMQRAGVSVVLAEAFNGTEAFYASAHLPTRANVLGRLLPVAQAAGLEVQAWIWSMPCNVPAIFEKTPEWFVVNKNGQSTAQHPVYVPEYRFLCPTRPEVRAFIKRRIEELAQYPITGIHLDYLQFPHVILPEGLQAQYGVTQEAEAAEYDFCYCEACRAKFKAQTDIDPLNFNQPSASEAWRQFRYDQLTELVNQDLIPAIRAAGKAASAGVLPDWENARQQWAKWQLDAALPLLYHALYNEDISWVGFQTQESIDRLRNQIPCYSGLQVSHLSPPDLTGAVRMALESGARGVGLFSGQTMSELHWQAFQRATEAAEEEAAESGSPG